MLFVESLTTRRAGRSVDQFAADLDPARALERVSSASQGRGNHTLCEYLHARCCTKLYLDYDFYSEEAGARERDLVSTHFRRVLAKCREIGDALDRREFVVAQRHGVVSGARYKVSFRVFFLGFSVVYSDIPILLRSLGQDSFWDLSVYKSREQLLSTILGVKFKDDDRVLRPYYDSRCQAGVGGGETGEGGSAPPALLDFVAQHLEESWMFLDLAGYENHRSNAALETGAPSAPVDSIPITVDKHHIRTMVNLLSDKRATDRQTWINVGIALKRACNGTDEFFDLWKQFSGRATDKGVLETEAQLRRRWAGFVVADPGGGGAGGESSNRLTARSIAFWAREDDPAGFQELMCPFISDTEKGKLVDAIAKILHERSAMMNDGRVRKINEDDVCFYTENNALRFKIGESIGEIDPVEFTLTLDGEYMGLVCGRDVPLFTHLAHVHKSIDPAFNRYVFNRDSVDTGSITSVPVQRAESLGLEHELAPQRRVLAVDLRRRLARHGEHVPPFGRDVEPCVPVGVQQYPRIGHNHRVAPRGGPGAHGRVALRAQ